MKMLAVDGNSILNRAFYGIRILTTKSGIYTNAVYGFLNMLLKILDEVNPTNAAICFDLKAPTFRHKLYDKYKAGRKGMPDELASQLPIIKEILPLLGFKIIECEGFEADDLLGTISNECAKKNIDCVIATGDRDSFQLINENVNVRLASTKMSGSVSVLYDTEKIKETYGIMPKALIDVKALMGDSSDNIPGVAGVGEKTALSLITEFQSIENIYNNINEINIKQAVKQKLVNGKDSAFLSYELGKIDLDAPISKNLDDYIIMPTDNMAVKNYFAKLEFFSLIEKFKLNEQQTFNMDTPEEKNNTVNVENHTNLELLLKKITENKSCYIGLKYLANDIIELCFNIKENIINIDLDVISKEELNKFLSKITANKKLEIYIYDTKLFYKYTLCSDIKITAKLFDPMLAAYLLNPSSSGYDILRLMQEYEIKCSHGDEIKENSLQKELLILPQLCKKLKEELTEKGQYELLNMIEIPLSKVLASMELIGFKIDTDGIKNFGDGLESRIIECHDEIIDLAGCDFNINSPKQLGIVLFEDLGLPVKKRTKTGYSTNAEILEDLKDVHPIISLILEYRSLTKLKSTYVEGLLKTVGPDGRIHTRFNQTETRTGRISSLEPNLQNIPVRQELGRELRKFFIADEEKILCDADYSQIELRVLAHIANDEDMINAFKSNMDIHTITASQVFGMPPGMVTPLMRSRAKAVNFGIVYGIGAFSLAKDIGVTRKEADSYIKGYLDHYSGVKQYMNYIVDDAKGKGYVSTFFGRRRYLPELASSNHILRSFGERVALNMPIQGTAADIIKIAMIKVYDRIEKENLKAKLILQVHDELIVEAPNEEKDIVSKILKEEMENAVSLKVSMTADVNCGKTWYDSK